MASTITKVMQIETELKLEDVVIETVLDVGSGGGAKYPYYEGESEFTPMFTEQVIETERKNVGKNLTIKPIPVTKEENEFGGYTIKVG